MVELPNNVALASVVRRMPMCQLARSAAKHRPPIAMTGRPVGTSPRIDRMPASSRSTAVEPTCGDGQRNGVETDIDCGGACPPCAAGKVCILPADCQSASCVGGTCQP